MSIRQRVGKLEAKAEPQGKPLEVLITIGGEPFGCTEAEAEERKRRPRQPGDIHICVGDPEDEEGD